MHPSRESPPSSAAPVTAECLARESSPTPSLALHDVDMTQAFPPTPDPSQRAATPASPWRGAVHPQTQGDAGPSRSGRDALGLAAVLLAALAVLLGAIGQVAWAVLASTGGIAAAGGVTSTASLVRLAITLTGIGLGVIALRRRDRRRLAAAIGVGANAALALTVALTYLTGPVATLLSDLVR